MDKTIQLNRTIINMEAEEISFSGEFTTIKGVKFNIEGEITDVFGEIYTKALPVILEFIKSFTKGIMEEESKDTAFNTMKTSPFEVHSN